MNKSNTFSPQMRERAARMMQGTPRRVFVDVGGGGIDRSEGWLRAPDASELG